MMAGKKKTEKPVVVDTAPLKRFLNKQQNLKTVSLIHNLNELQKNVEETRNQPNVNYIPFPEGIDLPKSINDKFVGKLRDQFILMIIDEIDELFLTLKENL